MNRRWRVRAAAFALAIGAVALLGPACAKKETASSTPPVDSTVNADSIKLALAVEGRDTYLGYCAMCHGVWGEGDGPMAAQVEAEGGARPATLNDPILLDRVGRTELLTIIRQGGAKSHLSKMMPPWGSKLSPEVTEAVANYVMALPQFKPGIPRAAVEQYLAAPAGSTADGRKLFVFYCTMCHGPDAKGDGLLADSLWIKHQVRPRNLNETAYFAPKTDQEIYLTVALGGETTGHSVYMPGWGGVRLSPAEMKDLVSYIRAISKTESRP